MVNSSQTITIIAKRINLDVSQISEYAKKNEKIIYGVEVVEVTSVVLRNYCAIVFIDVKCA